MFTGIIEELGTVTAVVDQSDAIRLTVRGPLVLEGTGLGDSIAVNGCCLTVTDIDGDEWTADLMAETLAKTALAGVAPGDRVNLERAVTVEKRLGGHIVSGHVDGVGEVLSRSPSDHWEVVEVSLPDTLAPYLVDKGSITVDGVSLTVAEFGSGLCRISVIPTTLKATTLGELQTGDMVNIETDILGKYVFRYFEGKNGEALP